MEYTKEELYKSYIDAPRYTYDGEKVGPDKSVTPEYLEMLQREAIKRSEDLNDLPRLCAFHGYGCRQLCLAFIPSMVVEHYGECKATNPRCKRLEKE